MKALVFYNKGDIRIEDVEEPKIKPGFVKSKSSSVAFAAQASPFSANYTYTHEYLVGPQMSATSAHPVTGEKIPVILGHEFAGEVVEVGEGVIKFKKGDRVCVEPTIWDGTCNSCKRGLHNLCDNGGFYGLSGWGGGMSEYCVIWQDSLYKLPDNVSYEVGALVEPIAVGWHAVKRAPPKNPKDFIFVIGTGPIGLGLIMSLKAFGYTEIIVSASSDMRKEYAKLCGAKWIVDRNKEDVVARVKEIAGNEGAHIVYDAAGVQEALDQGIDALRAHGIMVNLALWEKPAEINAVKMLVKEKYYQAAITYVQGEFDEVLDSISKGDMTPEGMITKKIKLDDVIEEGFKTMLNDRANTMKILVEP